LTYCIRRNACQKIARKSVLDEGGIIVTIRGMEYQFGREEIATKCLAERNCSPLLGPYNLAK
jgi:hypothetical protein